MSKQLKLNLQLAVVIVKKTLQIGNQQQLQF